MRPKFRQRRISNRPDTRRLTSDLPFRKVTLPNVVTQDFTFFKSKRKIKSVEMEILNADVNYFKYHRSIEVRGDTYNPFSEPSVIYSNIEGGLGCFGAYNSGKVVYR